MEQFILELLKALFPAGVTLTGAVLAFFLILLFYPEKIDKWQEIIWGGIERVGFLRKEASKKKIKHSIQSRVMDFAKKLGYNLPDFLPPAVRVEWVEGDMDKKSFIDNGEAVIILRREDPNNDNVASACMMYVSDILLRKTRRYLSPTQKQSLELYIGYKILQDDIEALDVFVDKWLYPGIEEGNAKVPEYFSRFNGIDESALFMPVFLQELIYLGEKVYGNKRDDALIHEVDSALEFLEIYSDRVIGQRTDQPYFNGSYCRFGIMIVGMTINVDEDRHDIYLDHIFKKLLPCGVETIYLIGPEKNKKFIKEIAKEVNQDFIIPFERTYKTTINLPDGTSQPSTNFICVLRCKNIERYFD